MHSTDTANADTLVEDRSSEDLSFEISGFLADTVRAVASHDYVEAENALLMLRDRVEVLADRQRHAMDLTGPPGGVSSAS